MKVIVSVVAVLALVAAGWWYMASTGDGSVTTDQLSDSQFREVDASQFGLRFEYRTAPDGYVLTERSREEGEVTTFQHIYSLVRAVEYAELQASDEPREGPPTISISIFQNPAGRSAGEWGTGFAQYASAGEPVGDIVKATVDGVDGVEYLADGLYMSDQILITVGDWLYLFRGEWITADAQIRQDFHEIVASVSFVNEE